MGKNTPKGSEHFIELPSNLDTPKSRYIFNSAIKEGYIIPSMERPQTYNLANGVCIVLLDYLCGLLFCGDSSHYHQGRKEPLVWSFGNKNLPKKELSKLFPNVKNIGSQRNKRSSMYATLPKGYETVDNWFVEYARLERNEKKK